MLLKRLNFLKNQKKSLAGWASPQDPHGVHPLGACPPPMPCLSPKALYISFAQMRFFQTKDF